MLIIITLLLLLSVTVGPYINPLNAELNAICYLLALLGAHPILHVSRMRVNWCLSRPRL